MQQSTSAIECACEVACWLRVHGLRVGSATIGKLNGGKGQSCGSVPLGFLAPRASASEGRRERYFGLSFKLRTSVVLLNLIMTLYGTLQCGRRFPICNTKTANLFIMMHSIVKLRCVEVGSQKWHFTMRPSSFSNLQHKKLLTDLL